MKNLIEELRACAKMHPLDIDLGTLLEAADVIERQALVISKLQSEIARLRQSLESIYDCDYQVPFDSSEAEKSLGKKLCIFKIRKMAESALKSISGIEMSDQKRS